MEPSLELITKKQLKFAFGLYQTYKYNTTTKEFPELTTFLQTQSHKMDLSIQSQGNSTDNFHRIKKSIKSLNDKHEEWLSDKSNVTVLDGNKNIYQEGIFEEHLEDCDLFDVRSSSCRTVSIC